MNKHPYLQQWLAEKWTVGQYAPSETFKAIENHSCVCRPDLGLIAVTGAAEDPEAQSLSDLIAAAPDMYAALSVLLESANPGPHFEIRAVLKATAAEMAKAAVAKADGQNE